MSDQLRFADLMKMMRSPNRNKVKSLIVNNKDNYLPLLLHQLKIEKNMETRKLILQSISWAPDIRAVKPLLNILNNESDKKILILAIRTLGAIKSELAIPDLNKLVNRSPDVDIIQEASLAIQVIQGLTPEWSLNT